MNYFYINTPIGTTVTLCFSENNEPSYIPNDPANTDYIAYLAWVAEGNTAEEWQPEQENN